MDARGVTAAHRGAPADRVAGTGGVAAADGPHRRRRLSAAPSPPRLHARGPCVERAGAAVAGHHRPWTVGTTSKEGNFVMILTRRHALAGLARATLLGTLGAPPIVRAPKKPQIAVVVKICGIPWFNPLELGIKKAAAVHNV